MNGKMPRGCKSVEEGQGQTPRFRTRSMVCSFVTGRCYYTAVLVHTSESDGSII